jgi:hypothetical protein
MFNQNNSIPFHSAVAAAVVCSLDLMLVLLKTDQINNPRARPKWECRTKCCSESKKKDDDVTEIHGGQ